MMWVTPMEKSELEQFLNDKAAEIWARDQKPYFLANVQPDLKKKGKDYRAALGEEIKLSDFARSLKSVRFIQHPSKPAIVGVIPLNEEYDVEASAPQKESAERAKRTSFRKRERVILDFLGLISELSDADLDGVNIPLHVLAKLLKEQ
ncbi:MAG: hypothetical protein ACE368_19180 [Paracoccaceae bacterium]